jgi:phosphate transport system substrate-binding protein
MANLIPGEISGWEDFSLKEKPALTIFSKRFHVALILTCASMTQVGVPPTAFSQSRDPEAVQKAREEAVRAKTEKAFYSNQFDLSGIAPYRPEQKVSGTIRIWGDDHKVNFVKGWEQGFRQFEPDVTFEYHMKTTEQAIPGLYTQRADIGVMGRQIMWDELLAYQRQFDHPPLEISVATGSYNVSGWTFALGIFVNKQNPISQLTMKQLDGIFGAERSGGWKGLEWDESAARGPDQNIRRWGQLGLTGEWADKPIHVYGFTTKYHFPDEFEKKVFHGGSKWNENLKEYANRTGEYGRFIVAGEDMMADLSNDPYGIAYGGMPYLTSKTKSLAIAAKEGERYVSLTIENVQNRTYPLTRDDYFYVTREPGRPLDPKIKEFIRYVLSRDGQEYVMKNGKNLPLTAGFDREQLGKLD